MDDFLKAALPANLTPTLLHHLPELDVSQPDKVNGTANLTLVQAQIPQLDWSVHPKLLLTEC